MAVAVTMPAPFWLFQWRGIWRAIPAGNESVFLYRGNVADVGELHC